MHISAASCAACIVCTGAGGVHERAGRRHASAAVGRTLGWRSTSSPTPTASPWARSSGSTPLIYLPLRRPDGRPRQGARRGSTRSSAHRRRTRAHRVARGRAGPATGLTVPVLPGHAGPGSPRSARPRPGRSRLRRAPARLPRLRRRHRARRPRTVWPPMHAPPSPHPSPSAGVRPDRPGPRRASGRPSPPASPGERRSTSLEYSDPYTRSTAAGSCTTRTTAGIPCPAGAVEEGRHRRHRVAQLGVRVDGRRPERWVRPQSRVVASCGGATSSGAAPAARTPSDHGRRSSTRWRGRAGEAGMSQAPALVTTCGRRRRGDRLWPLHDAAMTAAHRAVPLDAERDLPEHVAVG